MYEIILSRRFKKFEKRLKRSGSYEKSETDEVISLLSQGVELPQKYKDHELKGDFAGCRECHVNSDLILLYKIYTEDMTINLEYIGSHSDLFG